MFQKLTYSVQYKQYPSIESLPDDLRLLAMKAKEATATSYSPYSGFAVGAALLLHNGEVIVGSNQENGAYPSGLCAERVALFYAGANFPEEPIKALAITAFHNGKFLSEPVPPCGGCRQVMIEAQKRGKMPFKIVMVGQNKVIVVDDASFLLPFTFSDVDQAVKG